MMTFCHLFYKCLFDVISNSVVLVVLPVVVLATVVLPVFAQPVGVLPAAFVAVVALPALPVCSCTNSAISRYVYFCVCVCV